MCNKHKGFISRIFFKCNTSLASKKSFLITLFLLLIISSLSLNQPYYIFWLLNQPYYISPFGIWEITSSSKRLLSSIPLFIWAGTVSEYNPSNQSRNNGIIVLFWKSALGWKRLCNLSRLFENFVCIRWICTELRKVFVGGFFFRSVLFVEF